MTKSFMPSTNKQIESAQPFQMRTNFPKTIVHCFYADYVFFIFFIFSYRGIRKNVLDLKIVCGCLEDVLKTSYLFLKIVHNLKVLVTEYIKAEKNPHEDNAVKVAIS